MIKAILLTLGLAALLSLPAAAPAQDNSTSLAVNEAVLRQSQTIELRQKLINAKTILEHGDLVKAAKLYQDSCSLATGIGSGIDAEAAQAVAGLTRTRLALARDAQSRGDLHEADLQVQQVLRTEKDLKVSNGNAARDFKEQNDQMIASAGRQTPL